MKKRKMNQIDGESVTAYSRPTEAIRIWGGHMSYKEWCEREVMRLENAGIKAWIETNNKGNIAVYRN